jgi:hypothetical protein
MHSSGVIGVQLLHWASSECSVPCKLRVFSVLNVGDRIVVTVQPPQKILQINQFESHQNQSLNRD